jgi:hypothetical protein
MPQLAEPSHRHSGGLSTRTRYAFILFASPSSLSSSRVEGTCYVHKDLYQFLFPLFYLKKVSEAQTKEE